MLYSYTAVCPPARGDNPRALALGLSLVRRPNRVDLAQYEIFRAKGRLLSVQDVID